MVTLGKFDVTTQTLIVGDPHYLLDTWCLAKVHPVAKGFWEVHAAVEDEKIQHLVAFHSDTMGENAPLTLMGGEAEEPAIGVEGGLLGIFDSEIYRNNQFAEHVKEPKYDRPGNEWLNTCHAKVQNIKRAGMLPQGVVAKADGKQNRSYRIARNEQGLVAGISVDVGNS